MIQGIDLSQYQGAIDWAKLASAARFVFVRLSYGSYPDVKGAANWANSKGKLPRSGYHYYYQNVDPDLQAQAFLRVLGNDYGELPCAVDVEDGPAVPWTLTQIANLKLFILAIFAATGRMPLIYTSPGYWTPSLGSATFGCSLWCATWGDAPIVPAAWAGKYTFWQNSNSGVGADYGCASPTVDTDQFNGDESAWAAYIGKGVTTATPKVKIKDTLGVTGEFTPPYTTEWIGATNPPPPPVHPPVTFSAIPATVQSGGVVTLSWSVDNVAGVWLDGKPEAGVMSRTRRPTATTTYVLTVQYNDGVNESFNRLVSVTPVVIIPPSNAPIAFGFNSIGDGRSAQEFVNKCLAAGIPQSRIAVWLMNDTDTANQMADAGIWTGYRQWWQGAPGVADGMAMLSNPRLNDKVRRMFINESEHFDGGSPQGILYHAQLDVELARQLHQGHPAIQFFAGTFSTGCPDFTRQDICDALREGYADAYNAGLIGWDQHTYSPTMDWIYKGMPGNVLMALENEPAKRLVIDKVGRDGHLATWMEPIGGMHGDLVPKTITAFTDSPTFQDWFETRWTFLFTRCGFNPEAPIGVCESETQVDEGGIGGLNGHGATDQQAVDWCKRFLQISRLPVLGKPSPVRAATIFQYGADPSWKTYDCRLYVDAMIKAGVWA